MGFAPRLGAAPEAVRGAVELRDVWHRYARTDVLRGVDLVAEPASLVAVLGHSGSGKTTLLRIIAGFEGVRSGVVKVAGVVVDDGRQRVAPERRRVGYVPQEGALFPHMRVFDNVAFGPGRRSDRSEIHRLLEVVGLSGVERRYPHQLSGGQQQRVALARALAVNPDVLLLDEPFSALDAGLRASLRSDLVHILRERRTTAILVTHDQHEALSMADRVAVLRSGELIADCAPEDLYRFPPDPDVARFVGESNFLTGTRRPDAPGTVETALGLHVLASPPSGVRHEPSSTPPEPGGASAEPGGVPAEPGGVPAEPGGAPGGRELTVMVRPEQVEMGEWLEDTGAVRAEVLERSYFGHDAVVTLAVDGKEGFRLLARTDGARGAKVGDVVSVRVGGPVVAWPA